MINMIKDKFNMFFKNEGFSIVEISVVLIILGILFTGVSAGFHLIERSRLQSIQQEFEDLKQSVSVFKLTYNGLPGDLPVVSGIFSSSIVSDCGFGNGDGVIGETTNTDQGKLESMCAWAYLADAKLLSGHLSQKYPGTFTGTGTPVPKVDVPGSKFNGAGFFFGERLGYTFLEFGSGKANSAFPSPALNSKQASSIAQKVGAYTNSSSMDTSGDIFAINGITSITAGTITHDTAMCVDTTNWTYMNINDLSKVGCILTTVIQ